MLSQGLDAAFGAAAGAGAAVEVEDAAGVAGGVGVGAGAGAAGVVGVVGAGVDVAAEVTGASGFATAGVPCPFVLRNSEYSFIANSFAAPSGAFNALSLRYSLTEVSLNPDVGLLVDCFDLEEPNIESKLEPPIFELGFDTYLFSV